MHKVIASPIKTINIFQLNIHSFLHLVSVMSGLINSPSNQNVYVIDQYEERFFASPTFAAGRVLSLLLDNQQQITYMIRVTLDNVLNQLITKSEAALKSKGFNLSESEKNSFFNILLVYYMGLIESESTIPNNTASLVTANFLQPEKTICFNKLFQDNTNELDVLLRSLQKLHHLTNNVIKFILDSKSDTQTTALPGSSIIRVMSLFKFLHTASLTVYNVNIDQLIDKIVPGFNQHLQELDNMMKEDNIRFDEDYLLTNYEVPTSKSQAKKLANSLSKQLFTGLIPYHKVSSHEIESLKKYSLKDIIYCIKSDTRSDFNYLRLFKTTMFEYVGELLTNRVLPESFIEYLKQKIRETNTFPFELIPNTISIAKDIDSTNGQGVITNTEFSQLNEWQFFQRVEAYINQGIIQPDKAVSLIYNFLEYLRFLIPSNLFFTPSEWGDFSEDKKVSFRETHTACLPFYIENANRELKSLAVYINYIKDEPVSIYLKSWLVNEFKTVFYHTEVVILQDLDLSEELLADINAYRRGLSSKLIEMIKQLESMSVQEPSSEYTIHVKNVEDLWGQLYANLKTVKRQFKSKIKPFLVNEFITSKDAKTSNVVVIQILNKFRQVILKTTSENSKLHLNDIDLCSTGLTIAYFQLLFLKKFPNHSCIFFSYTINQWLLEQDMNKSKPFETSSYRSILDVFKLKFAQESEINHNALNIVMLRLIATIAADYFEKEASYHGIQLPDTRFQCTELRSDFYGLNLFDLDEYQLGNDDEYPFHVFGFNRSNEDEWWTIHQMKHLKTYLTNKKKGVFIKINVIGEPEISGRYDFQPTKMLLITCFIQRLSQLMDLSRNAVENDFFEATRIERKFLPHVQSHIMSNYLTFLQELNNDLIDWVSSNPVPMLMTWFAEKREKDFKTFKHIIHNLLKGLVFSEKFKEASCASAELQLAFFPLVKSLLDHKTLLTDTDIPAIKKSIQQNYFRPCLYQPYITDLNIGIAQQEQVMAALRDAMSDKDWSVPMIQTAFESRGLQAAREKSDQLLLIFSDENKKYDKPPKKQKKPKNNKLKSTQKSLEIDLKRAPSPIMDSKDFLPTRNDSLLDFYNTYFEGPDFQTLKSGVDDQSWIEGMHLFFGQSFESKGAAKQFLENELGIKKEDNKNIPVTQSESNNSHNQMSDKLSQIISSTNSEKIELAEKKQLKDIKMGPHKRESDAPNARSHDDRGSVEIDLQRTPSPMTDRSESSEEKQNKAIKTDPYKRESDDRNGKYHDDRDGLKIDLKNGENYEYSHKEKVIPSLVHVTNPKKVAASNYFPPNLTYEQVNAQLKSNISHALMDIYLSDFAKQCEKFIMNTKVKLEPYQLNVVNQWLFKLLLANQGQFTLTYDPAVWHQLSSVKKSDPFKQLYQFLLRYVDHSNLQQNDMQITYHIIQVCCYVTNTIKSQPNFRRG